MRKVRKTHYVVQENFATSSVQERDIRLKALLEEYVRRQRAADGGR
jgi:hypothetical protein